MLLTPHITPPTHIRTPWSISNALERYAAAEGSGLNRVHGVTLHGYVTRINRPASGASFIQLTDHSAHIEAVVPGKRTHLLPESLATAQRVEVTGILRRYRGSAPQIEVSRIRILGEALSPSPKLESPPAAVLPSVGTLGLITGAGSAAFRDVMEVVQNRCPWLDIIHVATPVQGPDAAALMADAILTLNTNPRTPDAILVTRGGAIAPREYDVFGDPLLLAVMRASRIPVYVAVGHAGDVTPACRIAARAFATPTLAAVSLLPDKTLIQRELGELAERLERGFAWVAPWDQAAASLVSPNHTPTPVPIVTPLPVSRDALLDAALARVRQAARHLEENVLTSPSMRPDLAYAVVADLCLARSILAISRPTVTVLSDAPWSSPRPT